MTAATPAARDPLRRPRISNGGEIKTLAIDLGTWSSAAALHENARIRPQALADSQERALRAGLAAILDSPDMVNVVQDVVAVIDQILDSIVEPERPKPMQNHALLLSRLADYEDGSPLHVAERRAVCLAIEEVLGRAPHARLKLIVVPRLHRLYLEVLRDVPPERVNVWPVPLSGQHQYDISSMLLVPNGTVAQARLVQTVQEAFDAGQDSFVFPGLKRSLLSATELPALNGLPQGWANDYEVLLGAAYTDIVRRFEEDVVDRIGQPDRPFLPPLPSIQGRSVTEVTVTFPTTLPPTARHVLRGLVRDSLGLRYDHNVTMDYDEAVAAALYFVLRDLGGDRPGGIDSFKARSQPVAGTAAPTFRQHMLVIDIGGGTTDIALVQLDLIDTSGLSDVASDGLETAGRDYILRPRVLGTTGHSQLGGDLLTLRMFYWFKAALADAIRGVDVTTEESLARQVIESRLPDPVPKALRTLLRKDFPTHLPAMSQTPGAHGTGMLQARTDTFDHIWVEMERAKRAGSDQPGIRFVLDDSLARRLRPSPDRQWLKDVPDLVGAAAVTLTELQFGQLVKPVVEAATQLATDLVHRRFQGRPGLRIDVVALSGRTAQLPQVQATVLEVLDRELTTPGEGRPSVQWDRTQVVVETRFAKQAASVGACWAKSRSEIKGADEEYLQCGIDRFRLEIGDLQLTLPADFGLASADTKAPVPLMLAGQPFDLVDSSTPAEHSTRCTRSPWRKLDPMVCLHRIMADSSSVEWGTLRYRSRRDREGYDPEGPPSAGQPGDLWFQIELAQDLTPSILICAGTRTEVRPKLHPMYGHDLDSRGVASIESVPELAAWFVAGRLTGIPRIEMVELRSDGETTEPTAVFEAGTAASVFQYSICTDGRMPDLGLEGAPPTPALEEIPGAVSCRALPTTSYPTRYQFRAVLDDGRVLDIGTPLTAPEYSSGAHDGVPLWAILDAAGRIRLHTGYPPYLYTRGSMRDMERAPGHVFKTLMEKGMPQWEPLWDPFTGDH